MNPWWLQQEFYCKCQGEDLWIHIHYTDAPHACGRCECAMYRPAIPEAVAVRILLGPPMLESEAADILLGKP